MADLELTFHALKRYSSQLTPEQYTAGIENLAINQLATSTQFRWELMGHHVILAKIKLYCLQELHITLAGYNAISDTSIADLYQELYHRLIGELPQMISPVIEIQKLRVARLLGFLNYVHPGLLAQIITTDMLRHSVRRILPADELLNRYVKNNGGNLTRTVTPTTDGSHVRLKYRVKDTVGTGRTLNEAVAMASERMADILYNGNLPTVHETFPQQTRTTITLSEPMRTWGQVFEVPDDFIGRILGFDQVNQSMDQLIESIGTNLCAIYFFNREMKLADYQEAGKRVVQYVDHVSEHSAVATAPYAIPLGQERPVVKRALVYRMFFYFNSLGMPINRKFEEILRGNEAHRPEENKTPEESKMKIKASTRLVTAVFNPVAEQKIEHPSIEEKSQANQSFNALSKADRNSLNIPNTTFKSSQNESKQTSDQTDRISAKVSKNNIQESPTHWAKLNQLSDMIDWVKDTKREYTMLLSNTDNPISMFEKLLGSNRATILTMVIPQLDRQKLKVVVPLIKKVLSVPGSEVILYAANAGHVLEEQPVGDLTSMTILALIKRGVKLRQMSEKQGQAQLIELVIEDIVIDYLVAGDLSLIDESAQAIPGQLTVSTVNDQPLGWWIKDLRKHYQWVSGAQLAAVMFDDRLKTLGF